MSDQQRTCPNCGKKYSEHPALSRKDNETLICADCGTKEALAEYLQATNPADRRRFERGNNA